MKRVSLLFLVSLFFISCLLSCGKAEEAADPDGQFYKITINGSTTHFMHPADNLHFYNDGPPLAVLNAKRITVDSLIQVNIAFEPGTPIVVGGNYPVRAMNSTLFGFPNSSGVNVNGATSSVSITEYGEIGEYIAGSFVVNATDPSPPNSAFAISGSFRIQRQP